MSGVSDPPQAPLRLRAAPTGSDGGSAVSNTDGSDTSDHDPSSDTVSVTGSRGPDPDGTNPSHPSREHLHRRARDDPLIAHHLTPRNVSIALTRILGYDPFSKPRQPKRNQRSGELPQATGSAASETEHLLSLPDAPGDNMEDGGDVFDYLSIAGYVFDPERGEWVYHLVWGAEGDSETELTSAATEVKNVEEGASVTSLATLLSFYATRCREGTADFVSRIWRQVSTPRRTSPLRVSGPGCHGAHTTCSQDPASAPLPGPAQCRVPR